MPCAGALHYCCLNSACVHINFSWGVGFPALTQGLRLGKFETTGLINKIMIAQSLRVQKCHFSSSNLKLICQPTRVNISWCYAKVYWAKVVSGPKLFWTEVFPCQSRHRAKIFSGLKYSLGWSVFEAKVCLGPKWVWDESCLGANWVLASRTGHLLFTQTKFKIHVSCDISAHANSWVCLHCDDVVSICKWNLLLLFF